MTVTTEARRWHWRTWNLLLQIRDATDGKDRRQLSGEMTGRGLCAERGPKIRALLKRGWIRGIGAFEVELEDSGNLAVQTAWVVTSKGRRAIADAERLGVMMQ